MWLRGHGEEPCRRGQITAVIQQSRRRRRRRSIHRRRPTSPRACRSIDPLSLLAPRARRGATARGARARGRSRRAARALGRASRSCPRRSAAGGCRARHSHRTEKIARESVSSSATPPGADAGWSRRAAPAFTCRWSTQVRAAAASEAGARALAERVVQESGRRSSDSPSRTRSRCLSAVMVGERDDRGVIATLPLSRARAPTSARAQALSTGRCCQR